MTAHGWPELTNPVLVAAFEGWNDAGDAATGAVEHLELVWDAQPLTEIDPVGASPGPRPGCRTVTRPAPTSTW